MNLKRILTTLTVASAVVLTAACSSGVKLDENADKGAPVEARGGAADGGANAAGQNGRGVQQTDLGSKDPLDDPNSPLAKRSIYFDFDSYVVKDEFKPVIEAHGKYLASHPNRKVIIQGNTDERGGSEYTLALGQKRAEAVRKAMAQLGVSDAQMEAVSFGEEKPKATGSDDAAFAENRRADVAYQ